MSEVGGIHWHDPAWLLLLPVAWGLLWWWAKRYRAQSSWQHWCEAHLLAKLRSSGSETGARHRVAWLLALLLTLGVCAAAGPAWRDQEVPAIENISARVLVLELSRSTLVEDLRPNRLAHLLGAARALLDDNFDGETGLVVYAGAAFVVSPLTSDDATLRAFLDVLNPETMPVDGARVDLAIAAAQSLLDASLAGRGQIVVFTDGIADIDMAAAGVVAATDRGHRVSWLGAGTRAGAPLKDRAGSLVRDDSGRFRIETTDFEQLQRLARLGRGVLLRLEPGVSLDSLMRYSPDADALSDTEVAPGSPGARLANEGYWLAWLMLPFTLLLFRRNLLPVLVLGCGLLLQDDARAVAPDTWLQHTERQAYAAFQRGDFAAAFAQSRDAILKGSACYRLRRFACAIDQLSQVDSAIAQYNLGNAYAQQRQFAEALVAWERALELDPRLEDAQVNRRLVESYLKQQFADETALAEGSEPEEALSETNVFGNTQPRIGLAGQTTPNPADEQQAGAGLGASTASGSPDPEAPFDGSEQRLEEFILRAAGDREPPDPAVIERWLNSLPDSSSELFRRKFLRDYQRQIRQER